MARLESACDYEVAIAVVGDSGAGKYSLIRKFLHPESSTEPRDGDHDVFEHNLVRLHGKTVRVHIFSPHAGYRTDYSVWTTLQPPISGALLVFDLTDEESLYSLNHHFAELCSHVGEGVKTLLVGNKKDLQKERVVDRQVALIIEETLQCLSYVETSATMAESAREPFITLITTILGLEIPAPEVNVETKPRRFTVSGQLDRSVETPKSKRKEEKIIKDLKQTITSLQQQLTARDNQMQDMKQECRRRIYQEQQENEESLKLYQQASEGSMKKIRQMHEEERSVLILHHSMTESTLQDECEERVRQAMENVRSLEQRLTEAEAQAAANKEESKLFWVLQKEEVEMTDRVLGTGGWAVVKVAKFRGMEVAAKCMHNVIITSYNRELFFREMEIAARVRHPNLLQFIGATIEGSPILLTELMSSTLRQMLEKEAQFTTKQITSICQNVALALNYLHLMKPYPIIHRDVSSANVLLEYSEQTLVKAKLSDYGSANFIKQVKTAAPGSPAYSAPESLTPKLQSPKMDVFSYGVLITEAFLCQFPDPDKRDEMIQSLREKHPAIGKLANDCLQHEPKDRPTMSHILESLC